jgi:hypothetical protein
MTCFPGHSPVLERSPILADVNGWTSNGDLIPVYLTVRISLVRRAIFRDHRHGPDCWCDHCSGHGTGSRDGRPLGPHGEEQRLSDCKLVLPVCQLDTVLSYNARSGICVWLRHLQQSQVERHVLNSKNPIWSKVAPACPSVVYTSGTTQVRRLTRKTV